MALESVHKAQDKQRTFYDRQSTKSKFRVGDRVIVFMPSETAGKDRKLARPYHGPYRVVNITPTNAEVQLIEYPSEPTIFVAIGRLRKCYPEQPNDCWLGKRKITKRRARRPGSEPAVRPSLELPRRGPITQLMKKASHLGTGRQSHPLVKNKF